VAIDDTNTIQFAYRISRREPGAPAKPLRVKRADLFDEKGRIVPNIVPHQDILAWVGQGPISDRTEEHLARSDKGVVLYHNLLLENLEKIERGEDPMGTIRDPQENEPMINIRRERKALQSFQSKYNPHFTRLSERVEG
jgi:5,5'-dehydrodivanillate O-demethylase